MADETPKFRAWMKIKLSQHIFKTAMKALKSKESRAEWAKTATASDVGLATEERTLQVSAARPCRGDGCDRVESPDDDTRFFVCARCRRASFCSEECFASGFDGHKVHCGAGRLEYVLGDSPVVSYRGKTKLHGTNSGVICVINNDEVAVMGQSRKRLLDPASQDNSDFRAEFVNGAGGDYLGWVFAARVAASEAIDTSVQTTIFGEWCGEKICTSATAVCHLPSRIYAVFAIRNGPNVIVEPEEIASLLGLGPDGELLPEVADACPHPRPPSLFVLPWHTEEIPIDMSDRLQLKEAAHTIQEYVHAIDQCDAWVLDTFGVEGPGEGLVMYPVCKQVVLEGGVRAIREGTLEQLSFKCKGENHRITKGGAVQIDIDVLETVDAFIDYFVTWYRLSQGFQEAARKSWDEENTEAFVAWVVQDVMLESYIEREVSPDLDEDTLRAAIAEKAREWFATHGASMPKPNKKGKKGKKRGN